MDPSERETQPALKEMDKLKELLTSSHVEAMKAKVKYIINGRNIRKGFSGPKSRIVPSESGNEPHVIVCPAGFKYTCSSACIQFKSQNVCSHTHAAAADNGELNEFMELLLAKGAQTNLTVLATANVSRQSGKKPGQNPRKRKRRSEEPTNATRLTLKEALTDNAADTSLLSYTAQPCGEDGMRLKFSRIAKPKPAKPPYKPTENTPFELIQIKGNIRVCAGCRGDLKDGPHETHELDSMYCIRHKENDHFFLQTKNQWVRKCDNKHYHINQTCIVERNPSFDPDNLTMCIDHTVNTALKSFLVRRLK